MKRRVLVLLLLVLAVLGIWLLADGRDGPRSPASPTEGLPVALKSGADAAEALSLTIEHEQNPVPYLNPLYEIKVQRDIVYASKQNESGAVEALQLDVYQPAGDNHVLRPVFIFIHGGGYSGGSKEDAKEFSEDLARRGYAVLAVNYRLKQEPSIRFTDTLRDACEDIADVLKWIRLNAETYGMDGGRLFLGGDSAGGQISLNFVNEYLKSDAELIRPVAAIVDIYGGALQDSVQTGLPPVLMIHGTLDRSIPYETSVELSEMLQARGIYHELYTLEGGGHDYRDERFKEPIADTTAAFLWNRMKQPDSAGMPEHNGISEASGDTFGLPLPEAYGLGSTDAGRLKVSLPAGWKLAGQEDRRLLIHIPEGLKQGDYYVRIALDQEGGLAEEFAVNVNVINPLEAGLETYYEAADRSFKTQIVITNQSKSSFSGSYEIDFGSAANSEGTYSNRIDGLEPGQTETLTIPELVTGSWKMRGFKSAGMLLQESERQSRAARSPRLAQPVQADGNLGEWTGQPRFEVNGVRLEGWGGKQDLSAYGYTSWDDDYFYLALEVTDDIHAQPDAGGAIWNGDGIQLALGIANADGSNPGEYHELGLAGDDQGKLLKWRWLAPSGFDSGDSLQLREAVVRDGLTTNYEAAIPWSELTYEPDRVQEGLKLKFSLLVNDNDGEGRRGWIEYNGGIGAAKDIRAFGDLYLTE